ncbi:hypothetical protein HXX76_015196 [Chlamydomonas incerta]|nr:hypothetical protein HXX76_015196 [Chlamydomonas incerta]|eukprot:KAG2423554.1 hypothetical protein HXX76_015196 [Chlamydomonas incerta]
MKEPGFTNCCYYAACLCCCGTEGENGFEEQLFIDRRDIKDVRFKISHAELRSTCLGCPCSVDKNESFMAKLYLTRWAGETRHGWINWAIDKDLKTYARNVNLAGIMDSKRSMELRKVLHAVACQNANAGAPPPPPPVVALLGGSQPPYSSQPPYGQQSPYGQQQPYSQQVIQRPYSQQVSQRQSTAAATAATTTGGLVGTQQAVTEPLITETITEPVAQQTMMQ